MDAKEHFDAGQLSEAVTAALADVKKNPDDINKRSFLCELLCITGDLERADKQLDLMGVQAPDAMVGIALFRQLIRAETCRQEFYAAGRVPEFVDGPTDAQRLCLEASIRIRENEMGAAAELLAEAEEKRPKVAGQCNGEAFDDWRDLDDLLAPSFEVLTTNGKYYWIPADRVDSIELRAPEHVRDLLWRAAHMVVLDGPDGEVYLPSTYFANEDADDQLRLGRATDWIGDETTPIRGVGQRTYLAGEADIPIMQVQQVEFSS